MTSPRSNWSTEEEETSSTVTKGEDDKSSKEVSEEEENSSEEGNEEEEKSSQEGIEEEEKSSSEGIEQEETSSEEGIEQKENSSEESEEDKLLSHQRNNHVEYFKSLRSPSHVSRMHGVNCQTILQTPPELVSPSNSQQLRTPGDKKVRFVETSSEEETESTVKVARKENNKKTVGDKDASKFNRASNECKICDKSFANPWNLSRHLRRLHGGKLSTQNSAPNQNVDNGKESSLEMEVDLPSKSPPASKVATQDRFKCYRCSTWFTRLDIVRAHFKSFHPGFPFKVISKSVQLKSDGASSKEPGEFNCGECGIVYTWKHNLVKHMRKSHGGRESQPKEVVVVTKKQLETSSNGNAAKRPAVIKTNEYARPFKINRRDVSCTKCGESFPTTRRLSAHLEATPDCAIEAGTESIQSGPTISFTLVNSDIADSTGGQNQPLEGEVGPEDPQSYRCGKCGRSFGRKTHQQKHMINKTCYETQAKVLKALNARLDFICQFCNKDMKHRSWLECHIASCHPFVHENAREYQHLDKMTGKASSIFFCPFCGLQKASRRAMTRHFRANHKELFGVPKKSINNV